MFFIMTSTSNTAALFHSSCGSFIEAQTPLVSVNMTSERLVLPLAPREFKLFEATEFERTKMPLCLNECTFLNVTHDRSHWVSSPRSGSN